MFKIGDKVRFTAISHSIESGDYESFDFEVVGIIEKILMGKSGNYPGVLVRDCEYPADIHSMSFQSLTKID